MDAVNRSRHISGSGPSAQAWAGDAALAAVPAIGLDALVPPGSRVVVVAPHPDDEILTCGALLHLVAERGDAPLIVAVTDGPAIPARLHGRPNACAMRARMKPGPRWPASASAASACSASAFPTVASRRANPDSRSTWPPSCSRAT